MRVSVSMIHTVIVKMVCLLLRDNHNLSIRVTYVHGLHLGAGKHPSLAVWAQHWFSAGPTRVAFVSRLTFSDMRSCICSSIWKTCNSDGVIVWASIYHGSWTGIMRVCPQWIPICTKCVSCRSDRCVCTCTGGATRMHCNWVYNEGVKTISHIDKLSFLKMI